MARYSVSLTKTIVIEVEAPTFDEADACAAVHPYCSGDPDGAWADAETVIETLDALE